MYNAVPPKCSGNWLLPHEHALLGQTISFPVLISTKTKPNIIFWSKPAFPFCFHLSTLIRFLMRFHPPIPSTLRRRLKRQCGTLFSGPFLIRFITPHQKRSVFKRCVIKSFSKVSVLISVFGRFVEWTIGENASKTMPFHPKTLPCISVVGASNLRLHSTGKTTTTN